VPHQLPAVWVSVIYTRDFQNCCPKSVIQKCTTTGCQKSKQASGHL